jgi:hypothetical protein
MPEQLYAIYPGPVTLYDGTVKVWTAVDLATAYGVQDDAYLVVNTPLEVPQDLEYFKYIHLQPRADDLYQNIKYTSEDDGQPVSYRPDFDASKRWIEETDPRNIDPEITRDRTVQSY